MTVVHATEVITPELARRYLDRNRLNRPVKEWRIRLLAQDMSNGNFPENGENGVTFDWNGNIAGGQHTLLAIARSGVTLPLRVTRNVDPNARSTMNDSLKQRFSDDLTVAGVVSAVQAEPLLRKVVIWESVARRHKGQGGLAEWRNARMSRAALASEWPGYAAGITATLTETRKYHETFPGNRGAMHLIWWVLREKHGFPEASVEAFFSRICYGSQEGDMTLFSKLRMRLARDKTAESQVFWVLRTWNAWVMGENLSRLQEPKGGISDPYPRLRRPRG